jgi:sugar transferase (PEP-CTERM system associated)
MPLLIGDVLIAIAGLYAGFQLRFEAGDALPPLELQHIAPFIGVLLFFSYLLELYNLEKMMKKRELLLRTAVAMALSTVALTSLYYMMPAVRFGRGIFGIALGFFCVFQFLLHTGFTTFLHSTRLARRVLVLGTGPLAKKIGDLIQSTNHQHILKGYVNLAREPLAVPAGAIVGNGDSLAETIREQKAQKLVVSLSERRGVFPLHEALNCKFCGIEVIDAPSFYEEMTGKLLLEDITPSWFIFSNGFKITHAKRMIKRAFDIACSVIGLILTLPLLPLVALLIKIDSRGPIFFRQERVGEMEKEFVLYKFRTMRNDAEKGTGAVWAEKNDPRITRIGRFFRKVRIDEFPQLYNVLKGEMSFVGPRPERPEFVGRLKKLIPYYSERHFVKPGITGWAQIRYPYGSSVEDAVEKLRYDLYYIKNISVLLEMLVIIETLKVMMFGRGGR